MPDVTVGIPNPEIVVQFTLAELDWLFTNQMWEQEVAEVKHPRTGVIKKLTIRVTAEDPTP